MFYGTAVDARMEDEGFRAFRESIFAAAVTDGKDGAVFMLRVKRHAEQVNEGMEVIIVFQR